MNRNLAQQLTAEAARFRTLKPSEVTESDLRNVSSVLEWVMREWAAYETLTRMDMHTLRDEVRLRFITSALTGAAMAYCNGGLTPEEAAKLAARIADATLVELGLRTTAGEFTKKGE